MMMSSSSSDLTVSRLRNYFRIYEWTDLKRFRNYGKIDRKKKSGCFFGSCDRLGVLERFKAYNRKEEERVYLRAQNHY